VRIVIEEVSFITFLYPERLVFFEEKPYAIENL